MIADLLDLRAIKARWPEAGLNDAMSVPSPARPLVVVVEADTALREALAFALETEGYWIRAFAGVAQAPLTDLIAADCLVLDVDFLALAALRGKGVRTPAVLLADGPVDLSAADALWAGVIHKPLITDALSLQVRKVVGA
ncbi:response regulator transcription factor [Caulobacter hibisci]|uniref:Chemotaxis protein CheY n=1 Tax=Caulobacter hibisci TaxID=2035993 RepID=A0ABS0SR97_9CAUL|nr:chemotaxis protein CheY [Caulobacter hibisci]MBI1682097.1 chemotaxis protein CheY [Caulobacter hibisci]